MAHTESGDIKDGNFPSHTTRKLLRYINDLHYNYFFNYWIKHIKEYMCRYWNYLFSDKSLLNGSQFKVFTVSRINYEYICPDGWEIILITEWLQYVGPLPSQLLLLIGLVTCIGWNIKHLGTAANVSRDYSGLLPKACHYVLNLCWSSSRWSSQCVHLSCPARFSIYDGVLIQYPTIIM